MTGPARLRVRLHSDDIGRWLVHGDGVRWCLARWMDCGDGRTLLDGHAARARMPGGLGCRGHPRRGSRDRSARRRCPSADCVGDGSVTRATQGARILSERRAAVRRRLRSASRKRGRRSTGSDGCKQCDGRRPGTGSRGRGAGAVDARGTAGGIGGGGQFRSGGLAGRGRLAQAGHGRVGAIRELLMSRAGATPTAEQARQRRGRQHRQGRDRAGARQHHRRPFGRRAAQLRVHRGFAEEIAADQITFGSKAVQLERAAGGLASPGQRTLERPLPQRSAAEITCGVQPILLFVKPAELADGLAQCATPHDRGDSPRRLLNRKRFWVLRSPATDGRTIRLLCSASSALARRFLQVGEVVSHLAPARRLAIRRAQVQPHQRARVEVQQPTRAEARPQ
jgi:hypothetical protein